MDPLPLEEQDGEMMGFAGDYHGDQSGDGAMRRPNMDIQDGGDSREEADFYFGFGSLLVVMFLIAKSLSLPTDRLIGYLREEEMTMEN